MLVFPAIDLHHGQCVRLYQGDFLRAERVANNALETALSFEAAGCTWLHMVDLDGSVEQKRVNEAQVLQVARQTRLRVQLGGGIRTLADVEYYLQQGVARVVLGSAAAKSPSFAGQAVRQFGAEHVAAGIDARHGKVAVEGWRETTNQNALDLAAELEQQGLQYLIYTDIQRDGTLQGPNLEQLQALQNRVQCHIIASGGVTDLGDVQALQAQGLYAAICGKSIYAGTLDLAAAVATTIEGSTNHASV